MFPSLMSVHSVGMGRREIHCLAAAVHFVTHATYPFHERLRWFDGSDRIINLWCGLIIVLSLYGVVVSSVSVSLPARMRLYHYIRGAVLCLLLWVEDS